MYMYIERERGLGRVSVVRSLDSTATVGDPCTDLTVGGTRTTKTMFACRGTSLTREAPPWDPAVGLRRGSQGGPRGVGVFLWARNPCTVNKP